MCKKLAVNPSFSFFVSKQGGSRTVIELIHGLGLHAALLLLPLQQTHTHTLTQFSSFPSPANTKP